MTIVLIQIDIILKYLFKTFTAVLRCCKFFNILTFHSKSRFQLTNFQLTNFSIYGTQWIFKYFSRWVGNFYAVTFFLCGDFVSAVMFFIIFFMYIYFIFLRGDVFLFMQWCFYYFILLYFPLIEFRCDILDEVSSKFGQVRYRNK